MQADAARASGLNGITVTNPDELGSAWEPALNGGVPTAACAPNSRNGSLDDKYSISTATPVSQCFVHPPTEFRALRGIRMSWSNPLRGSEWPAVWKLGT